MADIFVSYARSDRARVAPLVAALEAHGWSVWWDPEITPGQEFDDQISDALDSAKAVIVVWTPSSVGSRWVRGEAREAADRDVLVPVRFENTRLPIDARAMHTTDLDDWNEDTEGRPFQDLLRALRPLVGEGQADTLPKQAVRTLAVLPLTNLTDEPALDALINGLTEDLITKLAQDPMRLQVTARNTVFRYRGTDVDVRAMGRDLNVKYVVEGSVQKAGDEYRLTLQLIETTTGAHLWADTRHAARAQNLRYQVVERTELTGQLLSTELTGAIAADITPQGRKINTAERAEFDAFLAAIPDEDLLAWTNIWLNRADLDTSVQFAGAIKIGERAVERRSQESFAHALLAYALSFRVYLLPDKDGDNEVRARIATLVERARRIDPRNPELAGLAVIALYMIGHWKRGLAIVRSLRLPASSIIDVLRALIGGEAEAVVKDSAQKIAERSDLATARPVASLAAAILGDYVTALKWSEEYVLLYGVDYRPTKTLIVSLVLLGRLDEARRAYAEFQATWPGVNLADELSQYVCEHTDVSGLDLNSPAGRFFAHTMPDALRQAGVEVPAFDLGNDGT